MLVLDDHHLFVALSGNAPPDVLRALVRSEVFTTASWYYRLARAANDSTFAGALSRRIESLESEGQDLIMNRLGQLPAEIGLLSSRTLVPVMAKLPTVPRLNHLAAEAIASAILVDGGLRVVAASTVLIDACNRLDVDLVVVDA